MNDLLGGQVDLMCDQTVNVVAPLKSGKIKAYAVASKAKSPALPNLPTASEAGLPGFELNIWYGLFAPKGTPKPVLDKLQARLQEAIKDPTVKARFADLGAEPVSADRAQARGAARAPQVRDRQVGADHQEGRRVRRVTRGSTGTTAAIQ